MYYYKILWIKILNYYYHNRYIHYELLLAGLSIINLLYIMIHST